MESWKSDLKWMTCIQGRIFYVMSARCSFSDCFAMLMGILREPDWHGGCVYQQKYIRRNGSRSMPHLRSDIVDTHPGP